MKIIKVSTELEMSVHEFPSGTIREHNKALCELIGNGCDLVEHVMPKRLYTELKMPSSPVKEPGKCVSMLIDEEGRLKLSKGECLDSDMDVQEPVNVIYQTAEDGLADTVKPRLELAGADCEKILVIDESDKSLSMADERLEEALAKTGAKVLILDPIQAYLGGGMDMNRANEARDMTKRLGALAEKYQCAILLIGHMNKACHL